MPEQYSPEIAFFAYNNKFWIDTANHLFTILRLPQIINLIDGQNIPSSVHTIILFGPFNWKVYFKNIDVWRIRDEDVNLHSKELLSEVLQKNNLPNKIYFPVVNLKKGNSLSEIEKFEVALFWLCERLQKGSTSLPENEYEEWLLTLKILKLKENRKDLLLEFLNYNIQRRKPKTSTNTFLKISEIRKIFNKISNIKKNKDIVHKNRHSLIQYSINANKKENNFIYSVINKIFTSNNNSYWLITIGIVSYYIGDEDFFNKIFDELNNRNYFSENEAIPIESIRKKKLCFSPLIVAWWYLIIKSKCIDFEVPDGLGREKLITKKIDWFLLENNQFIDYNNKNISFSLLYNWNIIHTPAELKNQQFKLVDISYSKTTFSLENIWIDLFKKIQNSKDRPLIRISLWPKCNVAAISLRYDVDRPVSECTVLDIINIQKKFLNAKCGSWFFFKEDIDNNSNLIKILNNNSQEIGIHLKQPSEAIGGIGCTFHSAPNSHYWRGKDSINVLNTNNVLYMEFFSFQLLYPRPIFFEKSSKFCKEQPWCLPIHFPLEGSTRDRNLDYFDNLRKEFLEVIEHGGHAIIGSHPDLNQDILIELIERENFKNIWFDTISNVVNRSKLIMNSNGYQITQTKNNEYLLTTNNYIENLSSEVFLPNSKKKMYDVKHFRSKFDKYIYKISI